MSISTLGTLFQFIGGLGMFLYGMESMADGLQKFAGNRLQRVLEILTSNRLLGVLVGAGVTAIIQSSSATTVMVVGFVNAGIINLLQATGIIMGANIGTTVTPGMEWVIALAVLVILGFVMLLTSLAMPKFKIMQNLDNREAAKKAVDYIPEEWRNVDVLINKIGRASCRERV